MHALILKIALFVSGLVALVFPIQNNNIDENIHINTPQLLPKISTTEKRVATTTQKIVPAKKATTTPVKTTMIEHTLPVKTSQLSVATSPEVKTLIPIDALNTQVRSATVNIFCTTKTGGDLKPISGSGIIINKSGVILTNAHVAQYLLLKDYYVKDFMNCIVRTGSPAIPMYKIELLYMPKTWLVENAMMIKQESPEGNGENDYALLAITDSTNNTPLPESFPFVDIDTEQSHITGDVPVLLSAYPANFLGGIEIGRDLWVTTSTAYLKKLYYFRDSNNTDAFSLGANILAQKGASGGAVVNEWSGRVQGVISTITGGETTGERDLIAISTAHIGRSFKESTGNSLESFLSKDPRDLLKDFNQKSLAEFKEILIKALDSEKAN